MIAGGNWAILQTLRVSLQVRYFGSILSILQGNLTEFTQIETTLGIFKRTSLELEHAARGDGRKGVMAT